MKNSIDEIVDHFGGPNRFAGSLDVTTSAVSHWLKLGAIPARRAIQIERITSGLFRAIDIPTTEQLEGSNEA